MLFYHFARLWFIVLSKLYFPIQVTGLENIPARAGCIFASNHVSNLDPFIVGICCRRPLSYVAKDSLFKNKFFAYVLGIVGAFPIKRNSVDFRALRQALKRLSEGHPLLVFPEGTRLAKDGERKIQPGIGFLAVKSGVEVIPVFIQDSEKSLPPGARKLTRHPVRVYIGKGRKFLQDEDYPRIAKEIMDSVMALKP